jgi:ABC-type branched-subunit amino acid transport system substrate-binding protein
MDILTDVGVDLEAGTIKVGLLSDLTGPFGPLVTAIVAGQEVYWQNVNDSGGINGLMVELEVRDTTYDVPTHVTLYEELKDQVAAFGHSTGSPHTVAINDALQSDGILAIPLTWYSGWTDPAINANLMHHGSPYCIEAMNVLEYLKGEAEAKGIDAPTLAIASLAGDYGLDSAAGAEIAAEALGLTVVYQGAGAIVGGQDNTPVGAAIAETGADIVWATATPSLFSEVYGGAIAQGFEAIWSGAGPSWNPAFLDSPIADAVERDLYISFYAETWGGDSPGTQEVRALMGDAPPTDYYGEGFVEAIILDAALRKAYDNGDMTQAGILAAAKSLESVTFDGLAPDETYVGEANDQLQRKINIYRPSKADREAGGTGSVQLESNYTSQIAADYVFEGACYTL